jgi:hypothetical protein
MAEDNPIEGLDPNQSAFEPMLDMMNQDIPGPKQDHHDNDSIYLWRSDTDRSA